MKKKVYQGCGKLTTFQEYSLYFKQFEDQKDVMKRPTLLLERVGLEGMYD